MKQSWSIRKMFHESRRNELHKSRQVQQPPIGRLFDTELVQYQAFPWCSRCSLGSSEWKGWKLRLYRFATKSLWITGPQIAGNQTEDALMILSGTRSWESAILGLKASSLYSCVKLSLGRIGQPQKHILQSPCRHHESFYVKHVSIAGSFYLWFSHFLSFDTLNHTTMSFDTCNISSYHFFVHFVPTGSSAKCAQHHHCQQYSNRGRLTRLAMVFGIKKASRQQDIQRVLNMLNNQLGYYWTFGYSELNSKRWSPVKLLKSQGRNLRTEVSCLRSFTCTVWRMGGRSVDFCHKFFYLMVLPFLLFRQELTFLLEQSVRDTQHDIPSKRERGCKKWNNDEMTKTKHMLSNDSPSALRYSISIAPYFVWTFAQIASLELDRYGTTSTTQLLLRLLRKREISLISFWSYLWSKAIGMRITPKATRSYCHVFSLTWKKFEEESKRNTTTYHGTTT